MGQTSRRAALALALFGVAAAVPACRSSPPDARPNVIVILTDDQTFESLPHDPAVMPYLQGRMRDPSDHWITFPNAFLNTPMCCPSRATLLTGEYSHHTGVTNNDQGYRLDESSTLATWLHDAGYRTGLVGKYLNLYPFGRGPYVPPGWDDFIAKENTSPATTYYDYDLVENGRVVHHGLSPQDYATTVLANDAVDFVRTAPADRPFFLLFTPSAPHGPWFPAPGDAGAYASMPISQPPSVGEADVSDKPAWVRRLPQLPEGVRAQLTEDRRREYETLLGVDRAVRGIVEELGSRGVLDNTVIFYLTDNGFSFGEHRWVTKSCPYEECIRTPFLVRYPGATPRSDAHVISNVDVAPTVAALAGTSPGLPQDGRSLVPLLDGRSPPADRPPGVLIEWAGGNGIPPWWGVRTEDLAYVELGSGERELYDLAGVAGPPDPYELRNRANDPAYARIRARLANLLARLRAG